MKLERIVGRALRLGREERHSHESGSRIVIFGDSHVHAIQEAIKARQANGVPVSTEAHRLLKNKGDSNGSSSRLQGVAHWALVAKRWLKGENPARDTDAANRQTLGDTTMKQFFAIARSLRPGDVLVSAVGGNQHAVFSTVQHPEPFDFFFPEDEPAATEGGASLIPFGPLYDYFLSRVRLGDGVKLAALRKSSRARMVHLLAPPPKGDADFIKRYHDSRFAGEGISSLGVSSPGLRLKFWQMQNRALKEICAELDIETLEPPLAARDTDGLLEQAYYARDATHANAAYGELVLDQLEQRFARSAGVAGG